MAAPDRGWFISPTPPRCATMPAVPLLTDIDPFYLDHRLCGELEAGVDGPVVWFDCECGSRMARGTDDNGSAGGIE